MSVDVLSPLLDALYKRILEARIAAGIAFSNPIDHAVFGRYVNALKKRVMRTSDAVTLVLSVHDYAYVVTREAWDMSDVGGRSRIRAALMDLSDHTIALASGAKEYSLKQSNPRTYEVKKVRTRVP